MLKISSGARGFSSIKIYYSEYPKRLISRINDVYVFFNKISLYRYFIEEKHKLHLSRLSNIRALVLLNLLNSLRKSDKIITFPKLV